MIELRHNYKYLPGCCLNFSRKISLINGSKLIHVDAVTLRLYLIYCNIREKN